MMKSTKVTMFPTAFLALTTFTGVTNGVAINRDVPGSSDPLDIPVGGIIIPLPTHGHDSSNTRRSYRKSSPYKDLHADNPTIFASSDELCANTKTYEDGDYYCQNVDQVIYTNVASSGEYMEVVYMDEETGECRFADVNRTFEGEMAPFDEPVSLSSPFISSLPFPSRATLFPAAKLT